MQTVLVINAGSSSVKFQLLDCSREKPRRIIRGQLDGIGRRPRLLVTDAGGSPLIDQLYPAREADHPTSALRLIYDWLVAQPDFAPTAIGHRVVHGGTDFDQPALIDDTALAAIELLAPLAELHQPHNLAGIRLARERWPDLPQVACFDTAFHRHQGPVVDHFAIPERLYQVGIRRYGFHGLSCQSVMETLRHDAPSIADGRIIVAHLGSGASMCAIRGGKSIESTMGFTPLDGLPMGTRSGSLDPGIVFYLIKQQGMSAEGVQQLLYHESGLKGLSGLSNDMRDLEASDHPQAVLAIDHFVHRVSLYAGLLAAALRGLDAFVFTGGIGENAAIIRARIAASLAWLGAELDEEANLADAFRISRKGSQVALFRVRTDEELVIARETVRLALQR